MFGPIEPLEPLGEGIVTVGPDEIRFGDLRISISDITNTSTERADTLQVATRYAMWQIRLLEGSAFRLHLAVDRWREMQKLPSYQRADSPSAERRS